MTDLENALVYDAKPENGKVFVGIRIENECPKVYFPCGYRASNNDKDRRKDILNLISILSVYGPKTESSLSEIEKTNFFPVQAYIGVTLYQLNFGYYAEKETQYKRGFEGKINWKRTIQQIQPQISGNSPVYLDFIIQKSRQNDNELITQIHKFCVYESFEKIGFLFNFPKPEKPQIKFDSKLFESVLRTKISKTFNERNLKLFKNMLDIVCFIGNRDNANALFYGTYEFHFIWEKLIDTVFGESNKQDYNPHYTYSKVVNGQQEKLSPVSLHLDSIMFSGDKVYVLDSKFYNYGITGESSDLPGEGSINKQMAYAEFVKHKCNKDGNDVYNAFIMPYDSGKDGYGIKKVLTLEANWKFENKNFEKIQGILIDTKTLMHRHPRHSSEDIEELARIIES